MANRWSNKEIDVIKNYYFSRNSECHAILSNRSRFAIAHKAYELGIKYHAWTDDEIELLKKHYPTGGSVTCAKFIDRLLSAIRFKAYEIGIKTKCTNGSSAPHAIISIIEGNRVIATCPYHGNVEHRSSKNNHGPRCKLCRMEYNRSPKKRELDSQYQKRCMNDPVRCYAHRLRVQLRLAIRNKEIGCFRLLPYSPDDLKNHLEAIRQKQVNKCPSCNASYGTVGFQIDHIIPLASTNSKEEIFNLFALKNLSLLCKSCNCSKGKKILC